jgi:2-methylcitrate dehydratase PrpD
MTDSGSRQPTGSSVAEGLGTWIAKTRFEDIPPAVVQHVKLCLLDSLGCGLFGATQEWSQIAADVALELCPTGPALLWGHNAATSPAEAAMVNGTAVHGFELDDVHVSSLLHPGAVTVPAVFAIAELRGLSGKDLLRAATLGYEVGIRIGICAGVPHATSGYHATGTVGSIAAAAGVAAALDLDETQAMHALAVGTTQASGLYAARTGAMAKRFHAGRAAQSGVIAGLLAERGFTGARAALEAPSGGFLPTMSHAYEPESILDGLGDVWETASVGFKAYASCASTHTTVDALDLLMSQGLSPANLRSLRIGMSKVGVQNVGWRYVPAGIVAAQMNGFYTAAIKLLEGDAFVEQFREERLGDREVLELIEKIEIRHDPQIDAAGPKSRHAVVVEAELDDSRCLRARVEQRTGSSHNPLSSDQVERKFISLARARLSDTSARQVISIIDALDEAAGIIDLRHLLSAPDLTERLTAS